MSAGKIVLAQKDMYYEGGLIFIDHGLGLMSAYLHLSDIDVEEGGHGSSRRSDWKSWFNGAFYWGSFGLARLLV